MRANVEERNLDFVLKDNGAYDPLAMRNAVRGGRNKGPKPAKTDKVDKNDKNGKADKGGRQDAKKRPARRPVDDIIADLPAAEGEEKPKKKRSHGKKNRGASGEKLSRPDHGRAPREKREKRERDHGKGCLLYTSQECRHRVTANTKLESASSRTSINWFRTSTASLQERFCRNVQVIGLARYFFGEREQERESNILKTEVY